EGRRTRRELFSAGDRAWAWFPAWTGWGIELMKRLNNFSIIMDEMFNETVGAMREDPYVSGENGSRLSFSIKGGF
ncbi:hypothetical protein XELAEV_18026894mg, partial [Xenopus laevis]